LIRKSINSEANNTSKYNATTCCRNWGSDSLVAEYCNLLRGYAVSTGK